MMERAVFIDPSQIGIVYEKYVYWTKTVRAGAVGVERGAIESFHQFGFQVVAGYCQAGLWERALVGSLAVARLV